MELRKQLIEGNQVSGMVQWNLGGYPQKVMFDGKQKDLPIVITLHGGPGPPVPFSEGCRGLYPDFTDRFIMVYWDQLGCGINNCPMKKIFTLELMVNMTRDLITAVRKRFPNNQIYLLSVSWGSVLSALVLDSVKDMIDGVVASGQVVKNLIFNDYTLEGLQESRIPRGKLEKIRKLDPEKMTSRDAMLLTSSIRKYTKGYIDPQDAPPIWPVVWGMLTSPDYRFRDFRAVMHNGYTGLDAPFRCLLNLDLQEQLQKTQIPYHIIQGGSDLITPAGIAEQVVESCGNPNLTMEVVPGSGHFFGERGSKLLAAKLKELSRRQ